MRKKFVWCILTILVALSLTNCSQLSSPSDADAKKAIEAIPVGGNVITGQNYYPRNVVILQKGSRKEDGGWPFKVRYTSEFGTKESVWTVYKTQDSMGNSIWKAKY